eukprot:s1494_g5.t1
MEGWDMGVGNAGGSKFSAADPAFQGGSHFRVRQTVIMELSLVAGDQLVSVPEEGTHPVTQECTDSYSAGAALLSEVPMEAIMGFVIHVQAEMAKEQESNERKLSQQEEFKSFQAFVEPRRSKRKQWSMNDRKAFSGTSGTCRRT